MVRRPSWLLLPVLTALSSHIHSKRTIYSLRITACSLHCLLNIAQREILKTLILSFKYKRSKGRMRID